MEISVSIVIIPQLASCFFAFLRTRQSLPENPGRFYIGKPQRKG
jgi:hypothetical protein